MKLPFADSNKRGDDREPDKRGKRDDLHKKLTPPSRARQPLLAWVIFIFLAIMAFQLFMQTRPSAVEISYTRLLSEIENGNIARIDIVERQVTGELVTPTTVLDGDREVQFYMFETWLPFEDPDLLTLVFEKSPAAEVAGLPPATNWGGVMFSVLPLLVIVAFWLFIMRSMRGGAGPGRAFSFGKSGARLLTEDRPKVTFDDVAGLPEAKQELQEIVEFLKEPRKFQRLGGKIPKGALLVGPPGTGKTLLGRAVAGEAHVPFLSISGSDFVEMFVGVGAARVRDLFEQGKTNAPCIIFIDEIDAVGRQRGAGLGGGHDEREQTLNQLLVEMDGFESNEGVILLAATNRPDVLDPALLRPGRFDRQIVVDRPDLEGRKRILEVSARDVTLGENIDFVVIARGTPGFSGADLANLVNEAALLAARYDHAAVQMEDLEEAKDKLMLGVERRSLVLSDEEVRSTAFHEAGHALVGWLIPGTDPIHKVTIIPRGHALGLTHTLPEDDRYTETRQRLLDKIAVTLGGRAAERLVLEQIGSGAAQDISWATSTARAMVCKWGMSDELGPIEFGGEDRQIFLGREISRSREYSEATAVLIDQEVRGIIDEQLRRAGELLAANTDKLHALAEALLDRETLSGEEVDELFGKPRKPKPKKTEGSEPAPALELEIETPDPETEPPPTDASTDG